MHVFIENNKRTFRDIFPSVLAQEKKLQQLDDWWGRVNLIGKINSLKVGTTVLESMTEAKQNFNELQLTLIDNLLQERAKQALLKDKACCQIALDVLIRNLFERTADIGFLATDAQIRRFLNHQDAEFQPQLRAHLSAYVNNYSIYDDVILLSPQGQVLWQLDTQVPSASEDRALTQQTLAAGAHYTETCRYSSLQPHKPLSLVYSQPILSPEQHPLGILCLCFKISDELERIFSNLLLPDSHSILLLLNPDNSIAYSSRRDLFPINTRLPHQDDTSFQLFKGCDYLVNHALAQGYQQYTGPGWQMQIWTPLDQLATLAQDNRPSVAVNHEQLFPELFSIHRKSFQVRDELSLIVLNGEISAARKEAVEFIPVLDAIRGIGKDIYSVFSSSIEDLSSTVLNSQLEELTMLASLAADILDRNLYERANDCRWWAQNEIFRQALSQPNPDQSLKQRLQDELTYINGLYTIYARLYLYDRNLCTLAMSDNTAPEARAMSEAGAMSEVGAASAMNTGAGAETEPRTQSMPSTIKPNTGAQACLALGRASQYAVSEFAITELYQQQPTYIYNAPLFHPVRTNEIIGGIGLVFDSTPQLSAMLMDILPRDEHGHPKTGFSACFIAPDGQILSSTAPDHWRTGAHLPLPESLLKEANTQAQATSLILGQSTYLIGIAATQGYREYKTTDGYQNLLYACLLLAC